MNAEDLHRIVYAEPGGQDELRQTAYTMTLGALRERLGDIERMTILNEPDSDQIVIIRLRKEGNGAFGPIAHTE